MDKFLDLLPAMIKLLISLLFIYIIFIWPIRAILKAIRRSSDRRYELERYKAETERMRAEAEAKKAAEEKDDM